MWAHSGHELFYRAGDKMMVVSVNRGSTLRATKPHQLFEGSFELSSGENSNYDVAPGDQRFLMVTSEQRQPLTHLELLLNWPEEAYVHLLPGK